MQHRLGQTLVCFLLAPLAEADTRETVELSVKPSLCIVDKRTPSCQMDLAISWTSVNAGDYCLHKEDPSLQCWVNRDAGAHSERQLVSAPLEYFMRDQRNDEKCATATVEVLQMDDSDRRRNRRSRHVWDLL